MSVSVVEDRVDPIQCIEVSALMGINSGLSRRGPELYMFRNLPACWLKTHFSIFYFNWSKYVVCASDAGLSMGHRH